MNAPQGFSYGGESYYGRPAVKASPYGWKVALYTFLGGLAGSAQVIATLADLVSPRKHRALVKAGRVLAAVNGALLGPALLVLDLHTPQRWYNMLRIFRRTSPMSIGSYVLTAFGAFSAASLTPLKTLFQVPAAIAEAPNNAGSRRGAAAHSGVLVAPNRAPV